MSEDEGWVSVSVSVSGSVSGGGGAAAAATADADGLDTDSVGTVSAPPFRFYTTNNTNKKKRLHEIIINAIG